MANKSKQEGTQKHQKASDRSGQKILKSDVKAIGTAIAAAVVGELAQIALNRAGRALNGSDQIEQVQNSIHGSVNTATDKLEETQHSVQDKGKGAVKGTARVIQQVIQGIQPTLIELVNATVDPNPINHTVEAGGDTVKQATEETTDQAGRSLTDLEDSLANSGGTIQAVAKAAGQVLNNAGKTATDRLGTVFEDVKSTDKGKKKNKKKNKKNKKNKKKLGKKKAKKHKSSNSKSASDKA